jgi:hypothetical protein
MNYLATILVIPYRIYVQYPPLYLGKISIAFGEKKGLRKPSAKG